MGQRRQLAGLRILITGASQGIGRALALAAAKRQARLILAARNQDLLQELADQLRRTGADFETVVADVTQPDDRKRMIDAAADRFSGLDILINNAGIGATGHFVEAAEDRLRKIMEVNFFGLTEITRLAIPVLAQGTKPMIVNISSIAGKRAIPARSEYSASKFAVQGFTEALRAELVRFGIDVLCVSPGLVASNFSKNLLENKARVQMDHMRSMTPEAAAELTLRAAEKGKNDIVLTGRAKLLYHLNRFFPRLIDRLIARKVRKVFKDEIEQRKQQAKEREEPVAAR